MVSVFHFHDVKYGIYTPTQENGARNGQIGDYPPLMAGGGGILEK
jgi:hypothetical protein